MLAYLLQGILIHQNTGVSLTMWLQSTTTVLGSAVTKLSTLVLISRLVHLWIFVRRQSMANRCPSLRQGLCPDFFLAITWRRGAGGKETSMWHRLITSATTSPNGNAKCRYIGLKRSCLIVLKRSVASESVTRQKPQKDTEWYRNDLYFRKGCS